MCHVHSYASSKQIMPKSCKETIVLYAAKVKLKEMSSLSLYSCHIYLGEDMCVTPSRYIVAIFISGRTCLSPLVVI